MFWLKSFLSKHHQMKCCGWTGPGNWSENHLIKNSTQKLYSCSCHNDSLPGPEKKDVGLCEHLSAEPPVYETVHNPMYNMQCSFCSKAKIDKYNIRTQLAAVYPVCYISVSKCPSYMSNSVKIIFIYVHVNSFSLVWINIYTCLGSNF